MEQMCRALKVRCSMLRDRHRGTSRIQYTEEVIAYHQRRNRIARLSKQRRRKRNFVNYFDSVV